MNLSTVRFACAAALVAGLAAAALRAQSPRAVSIHQPLESARPLAVDRGAAALAQSLRKLQTRASVLMIVAHPDDEDGGMLDFESRGQGARVALLTLNRGEGGANVMSPDYWDALGLVRTEELLHAGRYYGVQQYWTRVTDYGFSKTKAEALAKWGHDQVLDDAVRVVRMTRPLVVTSVFIGGTTDGHGNHQVAGQMAQEVFAAACDPNMFPDQIKAGLRPWCPAKTYGRVPFFLEAGRISPKGIYDYASHDWAPAGYFNYITRKWTPGAMAVTVRIPEGDYDPVLGENYVQISRRGLGFQKSQNGGTGVPDAGAESSAYHRFGTRVGGAASESSFFDGVDTSLEGIASLAGTDNDGFLKTGLGRLNALVERAVREYNAAAPGAIAPTLAAGLKATDALIAQVLASSLGAEGKYDVEHELRVKQAQFNAALVNALGLSMQATVAPERPPTGLFARFMGTPPSFSTAIPGQKFWANVHLNNASAEPVDVTGVTLQAAAGPAWPTTQLTPAPAKLANNQPADVRFAVEVPANAPLTRPYFSRSSIEQANYTINVPNDLNRPLAPYPLDAWATLRYDGATLHLGEVLQTVTRETGPGQVLNPLVVAPAISVAISPIAGIVPLPGSFPVSAATGDGRPRTASAEMPAGSFPLSVTIHSNVKGPAKGSVQLELPAGWTSSPTTAAFATSADGQDQVLTFAVTPAHLAAQRYTLTAVASYDGQEYRQGYHTVGYPGLRPYNLYRNATYAVTGVNVQVAPHLNVGYIMGSGDDVPQSLENLGIHVHFLSPEDLASADLSRYNVILLGVRTYAVRPDLVSHNGRLLEYVKNGGVVVVQYNTPEFDHNYGPYPYVMGNDPEEVTDETSPMMILEPSSPVLNWPNHITTRDFEGWIEERGSKFLQSWDPHYHALLETHDPHQPPQKGGLVYARYGKGVWVYEAYAFYRELPEGVPGAYRLFANLVSLPGNSAFFPAPGSGAGGR